MYKEKKRNERIASLIESVKDDMLDEGITYQEMAKRLAAFAKVHELYNWASIAWLVDCAIENGSFVVINADW